MVHQGTSGRFGIVKLEQSVMKCEDRIEVTWGDKKCIVLNASPRIGRVDIPMAVIHEALGKVRDKTKTIINQMDE